jgi:hypothetical protein
MTGMWILGGLLVAFGCALLVAAVVQKGRSAESQRLTMLAALAMVAIGAVAVGAGALAGEDDGDDDGDPVAVGASDTTETSATAGETSEPSGGDGGTDLGDKPDDEPGSESGEASGDVPLPDCVEDHIAAEPRVHPEDHQQIDVGVDNRVLVAMHQFEAIALELVDGEELIAVARVGDQALPVDDTLVVHDVVDPSCAPVSFTPEATADEVAETHTTVIPLELDGRSYELTFVQHSIQPELDVILEEV